MILLLWLVNSFAVNLLNLLVASSALHCSVLARLHRLIVDLVARHYTVIDSAAEGKFPC